MKIVAFLQNPWFPPGTAERHIIAYRDNQAFHRRLLEGTMSGKRLREAFEDLYEVIHWDNTNWRPAYMASGREEPDHQHMIDVLQREKPDLVLCFGNQARDAMRALNRLANRNDPFLVCHHPNARHRTQMDLNNFAILVRSKIHEHELLGGKNLTAEWYDRD